MIPRKLSPPHILFNRHYRSELSRKELPSMPRSKRNAVFTILVLLVVTLTWAVAPIAVGALYPDLAQRGQFGDLFGAVNALFSGLAFAGVIMAILLQREELQLQREELAATRTELARAAVAQEESRTALQNTIYAQQEIARKRASFDFFLQTEMNRKMLKAYEGSREGFKLLRENTPIAAFLETEHYKRVRRYLNVHELMAVAIEKDVLDDHVCRRFWSDQLGDYRDARALIDYLRTSGIGTPRTYADLEEMHNRWIA